MAAQKTTKPTAPDGSGNTGGTPALTATGTTLTVDETWGEQNLTETATPTGDANDNDSALSSLSDLFLSYLPADSTPIAAGISGYTGTGTGSDVVTVSSSAGATLSNLRWSDSQGRLLDGADSGLQTLDGSAILLYSSPDNDNLVLGKVGDTIVFALWLEQTASGAKVQTVLYEPIRHPTTGTSDESVNLADKLYVSAEQSQEFLFTNAPSGQNLFLMLGSASAGIVVTGASGTTINTSQGGGTTTIGVSNQMVDPGEKLYLTYVTGANPNYTIPNLDQNEADRAQNIDFKGVLGVYSGSFKVSQLQPAKAATVTLTAFTTDAESGRQFVNGIGDADDRMVAITRVVVRDANGAIVDDSSDPTAGNGIEFQLSGTGSARVIGVTAGHSIEYYTGTTTHSRLLIENTGTNADAALNASFDIGGVTILDGASSVLEVGSRISFEDDGPTAAVTLQGTPTLVIDETPGRQESLESGAPATTDGQSLGQATILGSSLFTDTSTFGADGEADTARTFALEVDTAVSTGLRDTASGETIVLSVVAGVVQGRTATTDALVFTVAVNAAGDVTLTQYRAVEHADADDPDEADTPAMLADGCLALVVTVEDGDGDTSEATIALDDMIGFADDGPTAAVTLQGTPTLVVDETAGRQECLESGAPATTDGQSLGQATILGSSLLTDTSTFGADGEADTARTFALEVDTAVSTGLRDTASGETIVLSVVAGVVQGRTATTDALVFTVAVNAAGDVTLTQYRAVEHADADDPDEADTPAMLADGCLALVVTAEDGDGDTSEATLALDDMIGFADDGPTASLSVLQTARLVVDETAGAQSPESAPEVDGVQSLGRATIAASALFTLTSGYGSDGPADASERVYTLVLEPAAETGLVDSLSGEDVVLSIDEDGETVQGRTVDGDELVFTVSVDMATGALTLTQYRAVMHDDPEDADESSAPAMLAAGCLSLGVTVTDGDGDEAYDEVALDGVIGFEDDGPIAFQPEAAVAGNGAGATFTGDPDVLDAGVTGDVMGLDASAGSDGRGSVAFDIPDGTVLYGTVAGVSKALTSGGDAIYLFVDDTGTLVATTDPTGADDTRTVFTVTLDAAGGEYTVDMLGRIDNGSSVTYDNFGSGKAGLRDWFIVQDPRPESGGLNLLVTGRHPGQDQVNNDSDDISVNNQWIDPRDPHDATGGEAVRFSFVYGGSTLTNTSTLAGITEPLEYYAANNVGAKVMQIGGSPSNRIDIRVSTYDDDGDGTLGGSSESAIAAAMTDDPMDEIVEAWVVNAAGETILRDYRAGSGTERYDPNNQIVFSDADGSVKFLNCATGHTVYVRTADGFNAVMYENAEAESGGKDVFALGAIDVGTVDSGDPITMGFDMTLTDADGDASTGVLDLALTPMDPYA